MNLNTKLFKMFKSNQSKLIKMIYIISKKV